MEKIEDKFTHHLYGTFERIRSSEPVSFEDAVRRGLKRGSKKKWQIRSKNFVRWYPHKRQSARLLSLGTWGEIHALFDKSQNELTSNPLHKYLCAVSTLDH